MELERIVELKKRLEKKYMAHPDVLSIGVGLSSAGNMAVIVSVQTGRKELFSSLEQDPDIEITESDFYETQ